MVVPLIEDNLEIVDTGYDTNVRAQRMRYQVGKTRGEQGEIPELELN